MQRAFSFSFTFNLMKKKSGLYWDPQSSSCGLSIFPDDFSFDDTMFWTNTSGQRDLVLLLPTSSWTWRSSCRVVIMYPECICI